MWKGGIWKLILVCTGREGGVESSRYKGDHDNGMGNSGANA